jgi:hypothetical protein
VGKVGPWGTAEDRQSCKQGGFPAAGGSRLPVFGRALVPRRWKELPINERLKRAAERVAGVNRGIEAGLAKLDRAYKSYGSRGSSVRKRKIGVLVALSDEGAQVATRKAMLGDDLRPNCNERWLNGDECRQG